MKLRRIVTGQPARIAVVLVDAKPKRGGKP